AALVASCLQLDPADRPGGAADIVTALASGRVPAKPRERDVRPARPSQAPPVPPPRPHAVREPAQATMHEPTSLAVLPVTCAPADEYLADGVLEDLTDTLSTTPGIRVRPTGVVRSATAPDAREIGQRLHVDHVV